MRYSLNTPKIKRLFSLKFCETFHSDLENNNKTFIDLSYHVFDISSDGSFVLTGGCDMSGIGFPTLSIIDIRGDINKVIDSTMNDYYSYYFNINLAKFNSDGKMVIVYASNFNIQYGIETYNIINGAFHNRSFVITSNNITYIDFHPDGKHIIFIDNGDLWLVDLYGKNKILLLNETYDIEYPCFSNDGSKLVYVMNNQIYVTDIEFNSNNDDNHHTDNDNTILTLVYRNEFLFLIIIIIILLLILYKLKKKLKS